MRTGQAKETRQGKSYWSRTGGGGKEERMSRIVRQERSIQSGPRGRSRGRHEYRIGIGQERSMGVEQEEEEKEKSFKYGQGAEKKRKEGM